MNGLRHKVVVLGGGAAGMMAAGAAAEAGAKVILVEQNDRLGKSWPSPARDGAMSPTAARRRKCSRISRATPGFSIAPWMPFRRSRQWPF